MTPEMNEKRYREYLAFRHSEMAVSFGGTALMSTVGLGLIEPSRAEFHDTPFQPTERQARFMGQVPLAQAISREPADHPLNYPDRVMLGPKQDSYTLIA